MSTRDQLYKAFGPKLIEALMRVLLDEINVLRAHAGLPERTREQAIEAIRNEYLSIPNYDWMTEED